MGLISCRVTSSQRIREWLDIARRTGMKYHIDLPEVTEEADLVRQAGLEPVSAIMIGGVYDGKAIDRHVFSFTASTHKILLEPPVLSFPTVGVTTRLAITSPKSAHLCVRR